MSVGLKSVGINSLGLMRVGLKSVGLMKQHQVVGLLKINIQTNVFVECLL